MSSSEVTQISQAPSLRNELGTSIARAESFALDFPERLPMIVAALLDVRRIPNGLLPTVLDEIARDTMRELEKGCVPVPRRTFSPNTIVIQ